MYKNRSGSIYSVECMPAVQGFSHGAKSFSLHISRFVSGLIAIGSDRCPVGENFEATGLRETASVLKEQ